MRRGFATLGNFRLPKPHGEKTLSYAPGSAERTRLIDALKELRAAPPLEIPCVVGGKEIFTGDVQPQTMPSDHKHVVANFHRADAATVRAGVEAALKARHDWENMAFEDRALIFRRAADLIATKYRAKLNAAVMLGTGKSVWQAEIDAAVEIVDFLRLNTVFAQEQIYSIQPQLNEDFTWNRLEYRALEGFVAAITPFNFLAIGANLPTAPALMGNTVVWKPSSTAIHGNYLFFKILEEAGMPSGVINFLPASPSDFGNNTISDPHFAGLHFTGSTRTFNTLWRQVADNLDKYKTYPRLVGETGGKNFHIIHASADLDHAVNNTVRAAFEYSGQKCSACSRLYVPSSLWPAFKSRLLASVADIKVGQPDDLSVFMSAVIDKPAFTKHVEYIEGARNDPDCEIIAGGTYDDSRGYFVNPTVILTKNPKSKTMVDEIFGPVLTVFVYEDADFDETLKLCDETTPYGLTGSLFARDRMVIAKAGERLRNAAGNFYINDKSTGAVVGEQPFGGGRLSGTNDKAGSHLNLLRWVSPRTVKETSSVLNTWRYPHQN